MRSLILVVVILFVPIMAFAANDGCGERNEAVQKACKEIRYKNLPTALKKFMRKIKCNVTSDSPYDYGYALDLNADGKSEYAFCCTESPHGPCGMNIFGKSADNWRVLFDDMPGYMPGSVDGAESCGFMVLKDRHEGYSDICNNTGEGGNIIFKKGKYRERGTR